MALVILVVSVVIILLGITVFFQLGLQERTTDFETTSQNLTACMTQLTNAKSELEEAEEEIARTSQDIGRYDVLYETKVAELGETAQDLEQASKRISSLELIKTGLESEVSRLESDKRQLEQSVTQLNTRIDTIEDDIDYWKSKFSCCKNSDSIAECESAC